MIRSVTIIKDKYTARFITSKTDFLSKCSYELLFW